MDKETKNDLIDGGQKALIALGAALIIVTLGTSLKVPWLVIPVATAGISSLGYIGTKGDKKTKTSTAIRWGVLTAIFTILSVIAS